VRTTNRRRPKRWQARVIWLAIVALLIDALLPTAVLAAARVDASFMPLARCGGADGDHLPGGPAPGLPVRHCTLCAGYAVGVLPVRAGGPIARLVAGAADLAVVFSISAAPSRRSYAVALPRAPPLAA
jgi:hypothetical protein